MCGIFGINERNEELTDLAARSIAYRGPDSYGKWIDDDVSLGFNRLAIQDLDERANQPMWDADHAVAIIFNGEIYNCRELKAELEHEFTFRTTSDTEVLLYGYKKYGAAFVERVRGMFAYAIYDTKKRTVTLFRDHAGIKPLYYYIDDTTLIFASETKAIINALGSKSITPTLDRANISLFYGLGYIPSPHTMYEHMYKVPRGSYLAFDLATKKTVGITAFKSPTSTPKDDDELFETIEQSIIDHLIADVPVGIFFSGGTDSSLIAAVLHAHKIDLETFSIAVNGRNSDQPYFQAIAKTLGIRAHEYDFAVADFAEVYEPVMRRMDEPNADMSIFPTYFVSQKASQYVKVILSGEGGDELFFGYDRQRILARIRSGSQTTKLTLLERVFLGTPSFKGKDQLFERLFTLARQPLSALVFFMSPSRDRTSPDAWQKTKQVVAGIAHDPLYYDRDLYLENALLRKGDYATSLNSIEGRVPLLDPLIMSGAQKFEKAFQPSAPSKPVLKRMLARYLPDALVYRPKSGFGIPFRTALTGCVPLSEDLDRAISFLEERDLLFARLPAERDELIQRYPKLCFALVSLSAAIKNNESLLARE